MGPGAPGPLSPIQEAHLLWPPVRLPYDRELKSDALRKRRVSAAEAIEQINFITVSMGSELT